MDPFKLYGFSKSPSQRIIISSSLPAESLWQIELEGKVFSQPILTETVVIVSTRKALYGIRSFFWNTLWRYEYPTSQALPPPLDTNEDRVYVGDTQGNVLALDIQTGRVVWQHSLAVETMDFIEFKA